MAAPKKAENDPFSRFFRRPPKQARSRALVEAVLGAFEEQLAAGESLGPLRLETLIDRAGIGIGSFYEYFSNKESLLGVLVGQVTERNFQTLLGALDRDFASLDEFAEAFASSVVRAFLERPHTTRIVMEGIARFGLFRFIVEERDRFVVELARVVHRRYLPQASPDELHRSMLLLADAALGHLTAELMRDKHPDQARCTKDLTVLALAFLRARHPAAG